MGKKKSIAENPDRLFLETRCYANYMETVPTAVSVTAAFEGS
jgi:hypothetical protein